MDNDNGGEVRTRKRHRGHCHLQDEESHHQDEESHPQNNFRKIRFKILRDGFGALLCSGSHGALMELMGASISDRFTSPWCLVRLTSDSAKVYTSAGQAHD